MKKEQKKKTNAREILEWVLTVVAAVMIALPIRAFAFELVRVDGISMDSTLANSLATDGFSEMIRLLPIFPPPTPKRPLKTSVKNCPNGAILFITPLILILICHNPI